MNNPNLLNTSLGDLSLDKDTQFIKFKDYKVKIINKNQEIFFKLIKSNDLIFSVGASGSGKTFLAIAAALHYLDLGLMKKIVLVRPAVEA